MELVELKNNEQLVKKFTEESDLLDTWKSAVEYPQQRELARNILVLFGSTYLCEAAFSRMKYLKNRSSEGKLTRTQHPNRFYFPF
ncbi:SCAN domain-containing protein 3-like [Polypterus senegalus]|uniref:SCAN domain-containing protein 3-like n=1 Tax=Polypterus senegalus TaxID=55291 RepID=UPI001964DDDE|nr:SCAN domain-containing protein 3-like [Polypterus senegalus]